MSILAEIDQKAFDSLKGTIELKLLYVAAENGMFRPDIEAVNGISLEDVSGLKSSLSKTLERAKGAEKKLKEFESKYEGIEPDKAKEAIAKLDDLASGKLDDKSKAQIEIAVSQFKEKSAKETEVLKKEIEKLNTEADKWKKSSINNTKTTAINEAIAKVGANPNLFYYLDSVVKTELQDDGKIKLLIHDKNGNVKLTNKSGSVENMSVEEHVVELKTIESFAAFFPGTGATGSGAGSSGTNRSGRFNLDELAKLPPAERLKKARELGIKT